MSEPGGTSAVAAIDCGTNSTRVLVADAQGATLLRRMTITRLGAGVDRTGRLAADALARTIEVLRSYRVDLEAHGVGAVRITATSAARDAANREDFFDAAAAVVGRRPELLGGDEEARLSFVGATAGRLGDGPWLVAEIGGGSTELALGPAVTGVAEARPPRAVCSLDMGCVRITERFLAHDPPEAGEVAAARAYVGRLLDGAAQEGLSGAAELIGLAGTVSAAASLDLRLDAYDRDLVHGHRLAASTVRALLDELSGLDADARRRREGMEAARADVIVGGLVVLDTLMDRMGFEHCTVSESDILDGLVMSLLRPGL